MSIGSAESLMWLGRLREQELREKDGRGPDSKAERVTLPTSALLRHMMALGSSGSGKTVLSKVVVEECTRRGVPAICVDPQGDICSLLQAADDPDELRRRGVEPELAERFAEQTDVVIFTPGAQVGVPLCADPIDPGIAQLPAREQARALTRVASTMTSLLGYELGSDDGDGLCAVLDQALSERLAAGKPLRCLQHIGDELAEREAKGFTGLGRLLSARKIRQACQRLARLDVGARRALFHDGLPIDVDMLLGRDEGALSDKTLRDKTRISVVYLNALDQQEDKELVVAALADGLYRWMLRHPSSELQALFYIDEVAPFIPPVSKPACKDGLQLLFKQARKYGLGCLMATQNPGDVDYKAMAQFGTWALGRLTTRQDRKKVEPTVRSLAGDGADAVMDGLSQLRAGQFVLLSPDHLDGPAPLQCRWLLSAHETFDERRIEQLAEERWRDRFVVPSEEDDAADGAGGGDDAIDAAEGADEAADGAAGGADEAADGAAGGADEAADGAAGGADEAADGAAGGADEAADGAAAGADEMDAPEGAGGVDEIGATDIHQNGALDHSHEMGAGAHAMDAAGVAHAMNSAREHRPAPARVAPTLYAEPAFTASPSPPAAPPAHTPAAHTPIVPAPPTPAAPRAHTPAAHTPLAPATHTPAAPPISSAPTLSPAQPNRAAQPKHGAHGTRVLDARARAALKRAEERAEWERRIAQQPSADMGELATLLGVSRSTARRRAQQLIEAGVLGVYQQGRSKRYWAKRSGLRPDLGLDGEVMTAAVTIPQTQAQHIAHEQRRTRMLGMLGEDEQISGLTLKHMPLVRIDFEEQVPRSLLQRALGPSHDQLRGSVYLHATDLRYLSLTRAAGVSFSTPPAEYASHIQDLDGVAHWIRARPVELDFDEEVWRARAGTEQASRHFRQHYNAAMVLSVSYVFLPYWELVLAQGGGRGYRVLSFDALVGKAFGES